MCGLRVFCLNILLSFLAVSGSPDVPENGQDKDSLIVLMLSKMQVMQDKIDMLEKSDREMKQRFADVTAKFQSEIDELNIQIQSFKSKLKSENTENESGIEKDVGHGDRLIQSEIYENDKETMQTRRKIGIRQLTGSGVAFTAYLGHVEESLGNLQTLIYNQVLLNEGQAYSENTGIFRAPITGVYLFSWSVMARRQPGKSAYDVRVDLQHNGSQTLTAVAESRDEIEDNQGSNTAVLKLAQGDEVWTVHRSGASETFGSTSDRETSFMGVLLYETEI